MSYNYANIDWTAVIAIAGAMASAIFAAWAAISAHQQAKYLEYSSRPTAYLLLNKNLMYVKNTSNFLVKFYFRMSLGGKALDDSRWKNNPLYIYPGAGYMVFPHAFDTKKLVGGNIKIEYRVVPSHIDDKGLYRNIQVEEWGYNKDTMEWANPNGLKESGVLSIINKL